MRCELCNRKLAEVVTKGTIIVCRCGYVNKAEQDDVAYAY
jgi:phage FluMu protein Com